MLRFFRDLWRTPGFSLKNEIATDFGIKGLIFLSSASPILNYSTLQVLQAYTIVLELLFPVPPIGSGLDYWPVSKRLKLYKAIKAVISNS